MTPAHWAFAWFLVGLGAGCVLGYLWARPPADGPDDDDPLPPLPPPGGLAGGGGDRRTQWGLTPRRWGLTPRRRGR